MYRNAGLPIAIAASLFLLLFVSGALSQDSPQPERMSAQDALRQLKAAENDPAQLRRDVADMTAQMAVLRREVADLKEQMKVVNRRLGISPEKQAYHDKSLERSQKVAELQRKYKSGESRMSARQVAAEIRKIRDEQEREDKIDAQRAAQEYAKTQEEVQLRREAVERKRQEQRQRN